ncbi:hypothetical protein NQ028_13180, partial [Corynebacterium phoceense]|nr:hypothetical protein [Corynebacterium phoceense]
PPGTHQPTPHPEKPAQTALTPSETDKNKKYIGTLLSSQTSSAHSITTLNELLSSDLFKLSDWL